MRRGSILGKLLGRIIGCEINCRIPERLFLGHPNGIIVGENVVLENKIMGAETHVSQGAKLSTSLEGFPPTLLQIISTGEDTGKLPEVLQKTSESYEAEFDRKLNRMISLLEPSLILVMGLVVGFIVVSVLMPIFELNEMMK